MKIILAIAALLFLSAAGFAEDKPVPTMPEDVTLMSGRVLHRVSVVRWEKDRVVLKYAGGVDPIAFSLIAEPLRSQMAAIRGEGIKAQSRANEIKANPAAATAEESVHYSGQLFMSTQGAGSYKFGGKTIYVFPETAWDNLQTMLWKISMPKPLLKATTNADGEFDFNLPKGMGFVLLVQTYRYIGRGLEEKLEWRVRSADLDQLPKIILSNKNTTTDQREYAIEGEER